MAQDKFEIVVCGPWAPEFIYDAGEELVISGNATAYRATELQRVAPLFRGLPVFWRHVEGRATTRLVMGDKGKVGRLLESWWAPDEREIRAILDVTSPTWGIEFQTPENRWRYGFSMNVDIRGWEAGGLDIAAQITRVYGVDLVERAAMAGRFADAPPFDEERLSREREILLESIEERKHERLS